VDYDRSTALLVVDVQNDFADPAGSLYVAGGDGVTPIVNEHIAAAAAAGAVIVYTQDWHPESTPHFAKDGGIWPVHCIGGSWGAELRPDLTVVDGAVMVKKGTGGEDGYSAFNVRDPETGEVTSTGLAGILRSGDVSRVVVAGLALDYCVNETAVDAVAEGFDTTVIADATRAVNLAPGDGSRAVSTVVSAGARVE
jgi:nicotinamidase/pyrazinamidase